MQKTQKKLDPELLAYFHRIKNNLKTEHQEYLLSHPEIKQLLSDYLTKLLLHKPTNIYKFSNSYFKYFEKHSMPSKVRPLLICGPSGSGKHTLVKRLKKDYPHYFKLLVSYTTRHPRKSEIAGITYNFVSKDDFKKEIEFGNFIEYEEFEGDFYGTNRRDVQGIRDMGKVGVLRIEVGGAKKVFGFGGDWRFFFVLPPSVEELRKRLVGRGTEELDVVERRVEIGRREIEEVRGLRFFEKMIVNDDFEVFYAEFKVWLQEIYPLFKF